MLSIDQYATVYVAMTTAMGNAAQEQQICGPHGFTPAQWNEAKTFYTARMVDPSDAGRTSIAFAQAMQKGLGPQFQMNAPPQQPQAQREPPPPSDFTASKIRITTTEFDVQMIELLSPETYQHLVLQKGFDFDPSAEAFNGNTFHVSINGPSYAIYGGVHGVNLAPGELTLFFAPDGQERMRTPKLTIRFDLDPKMYAYLARKMRFVFADKLYIAPVAPPMVMTVAGMELNDEKVSKAVGENMRVNARTKLQSLKASGKFPVVVYATLESSTVFEGADRKETALFAEAEAALKDTLERDLTSVIAFDVTNRSSKRFYIYTSLSQEDLMGRVNDALRTLPKLPLSFGGGEDATWENYEGCMADLAG